MSLTIQKIRANLKNQRVLLVGGAGFIGHNLSLGLRDYGVEVMVVDNLMLNNLVNIVCGRTLDEHRRRLYHGFLLQRFDLMRDRGVHACNADARSIFDLTSVFQEFMPTKVVHLTAIASAVEARKQPGMCFDLQLLTLRHMLEICRTQKAINQVVFMSSSTIYGDFRAASVDENVRPRPYGIYANAKFMGERLVRTYAHQYGLGCSIIRPSALYGERCISQRVSQKFIENALMGTPLLLEGGGDGCLDFTHISDLVDGIIRAMAVVRRSDETSTYNLTYGNAQTIRTLADIVKDVIPDAVFEFSERDSEKPIRGTLSTKRARKVLGFQPKSALQDAYKHYCKWYVDQWERTMSLSKVNI